MPFCLIVDDEELHREIDQCVIRHLGFETQEAANGKEAMEVCEEHMPNIILLDLMMPEMSGLQFLDKLRHMKEGKSPYVIVCSANGVESMRQKALEAGADAFLLKPFSPQSLLQTIAEGGFHQ